MLVVYHINIFSLAREKRDREVEICAVHFDRFRHFFTVLLFQVTYAFQSKRSTFLVCTYCFYTESKLKHFLIAFDDRRTQP